MQGPSMNIRSAVQAHGLPHALFSAGWLQLQQRMHVLLICMPVPINVQAGINRNDPADPSASSSENLVWSQPAGFSHGTFQLSSATQQSSSAPWHNGSIQPILSFQGMKFMCSVN